MRCNPALIAAVSAVIFGSAAQAQVVLNETFDDGLAADRFDVRTIKPATPSTLEDVNFNYNYGAFQYANYASGTPTPSAGVATNIPSAPGSGGTTTGLRLGFTAIDPPVTGGSTIMALGVLPKAVNVADNFRIEGYMWLNYNGGPGDQFSTQGGAGSTEYMTVGLRRSGDSLTGPFPVGANSPGYAFTFTGEGGQANDARMHNTDVGDDGPAFAKRNGAWFAGTREIRYSLTTGNYVPGGTTPTLITDTPDNQAHSYYRSEVFPNSEGFEIAGAPAKKWVKFEVEQHGRISTYSFNGKAIGVLFNSESFNGTPQFGYFDRTNGLPPTTNDPITGVPNRQNQFVLYDNLLVTQLGAATPNAVVAGTNYAAFNAGGSYTADGAATLSYLEIGSADAVNISGTGTLTFGGQLGAVQSIGNGTHTISKPVAVTVDTAISVVGTGTLDLSNVTWSASTTAGLNKNGIGTLRLPNLRAQYLMLNDGKVQFTGAGPLAASKVGSLDVGYATPSAVTAGSQIDIGRTVLAVDYIQRAGAPDPTFNASPLASLSGRLNTGYAADGEGNPQWNGPGIVTSAPEVLGAGFLNSAYVVRILEASVLGYGETPSNYGSSGFQIDSTTVLVGFSYKADFNFDQRVNFADLVILAQNYNQDDRAWYQGNATPDGIFGNGTVNFADLVILAQSYNQTVGTPGALGSVNDPGFQADWARALAMVPEPTTLTVLGLGAAAAIRRRR